MTVISDLFLSFGINVSRETEDKLELYKKLLLSFNEKFNLIGPATIPIVEERHFLDSAQLFSYINISSNILDVGTGAGFPGLVLAIMGAKNVTLVDSSHKKCEFLRTVSRETNTPVVVECCRVEDYKDKGFDEIVSRAVAPVEKIFSLTHHLVSSKTKYLLLKGERGEEELKQAQNKWLFTCERKKSITHSKGVVFLISQVSKKSEKNNQYCKSKRGGWKNNNNR